MALGSLKTENIIMASVISNGNEMFMVLIWPYHPVLCDLPMCVLVLCP